MSDYYLFLAALSNGCCYLVHGTYLKPIHFCFYSSLFIIPRSHIFKWMLPKLVT